VPGSPSYQIEARWRAARYPAIPRVFPAPAPAPIQSTGAIAASSGRHIEVPAWGRAVAGPTVHNNEGTEASPEGHLQAGGDFSNLSLIVGALPTGVYADSFEPRIVLSEICKTARRRLAETPERCPSFKG